MIRSHARNNSLVLPESGVERARSGDTSGRIPRGRGAIQRGTVHGWQCGAFAFTVVLGVVLVANFPMGETKILVNSWSEIHRGFVFDRRSGATLADPSVSIDAAFNQSSSTEKESNLMGIFWVADGFSPTQTHGCHRISRPEGAQFSTRTDNGADISPTVKYPRPRPTPTTSDSSTTLIFSLVSFPLFSTRSGFPFDPGGRTSFPFDPGGSETMSNEASSPGDSTVTFGPRDPARPTSEDTTQFDNTHVPLRESDLRETQATQAAQADVLLRLMTMLENGQRESARKEDERRQMLSTGPVQVKQSEVQHEEKAITIKSLSLPDHVEIDKAAATFQQELRGHQLNASSTLHDVYKAIVMSVPVRYKWVVLLAESIEIFNDSDTGAQHVRFNYRNDLDDSTEGFSMDIEDFSQFLVQAAEKDRPRLGAASKVGTKGLLGGTPATDIRREQVLRLLFSVKAPYISTTASPTAQNVYFAWHLDVLNAFFKVLQQMLHVHVTVETEMMQYQYNHWAFLLVLARIHELKPTRHRTELLEATNKFIEACDFQLKVDKNKVVCNLHVYANNIVKADISLRNSTTPEEYATTKGHKQAIENIHRTFTQVVADVSPVMYDKYLKSLLDVTDPARDASLSVPALASRMQAIGARIQQDYPDACNAGTLKASKPRGAPLPSSLLSPSSTPTPNVYAKAATPAQTTSGSNPAVPDGQQQQATGPSEASPIQGCWVCDAKDHRVGNCPEWERFQQLLVEKGYKKHPTPRPPVTRPWSRGRSRSPPRSGGSSRAQSRSRGHSTDRNDNRGGRSYSREDNRRDGYVTPPTGQAGTRQVFVAKYSGASPDAPETGRTLVPSYAAIAQGVGARYDTSGNYTTLDLPSNPVAAGLSILRRDEVQEETDLRHETMELRQAALASFPVVARHTQAIETEESADDDAGHDDDSTAAPMGQAFWLTAWLSFLWSLMMPWGQRARGQAPPRLYFDGRHMAVTLLFALVSFLCMPGTSSTPLTAGMSAYCDTSGTGAYCDTSHFNMSSTGLGTHSQHPLLVTSYAETMDLDLSFTKHCTPMEIGGEFDLMMCVEMHVSAEQTTCSGYVDNCLLEQPRLLPPTEHRRRRINLPVTTCMSPDVVFGTIHATGLWHEELHSIMCTSVTVREVERTSIGPSFSGIMYLYRAASSVMWMLGMMSVVICSIEQRVRGVVEAVLHKIGLGQYTQHEHAIKAGSRWPSTSLRLVCNLRLAWVLTLVMLIITGIRIDPPMGQVVGPPVGEYAKAIPIDLFHDTAEFEPRLRPVGATGAHPVGVGLSRRVVDAVDSGASITLAFDSSSCTDIRLLPKPEVIEGVGGAITCTHVGTLHVTAFDDEDNMVYLAIPNARIQDPNESVKSDFPYNLVSVTDLNRLGYNVRFDVDEPHLRHAGTGAYVRMVQQRDKLFTFATCPAALASRRHAALPSDAEDLMAKLHSRFHAADKRILKSCELLPSMQPAADKLKDYKPGNKICHDCSVANIRRSAREPASTRHVENIKSGWSLDLFDMGELTSLGGSRYVFVFVVWKSRYVHVELGSRKSDALAALRRTCARLGYYPKELRSDNAPEFFDEKFTEFCEEHLINHVSSVAYSQSQNGLAETRVNEISKMLRVLMRQSALPTNLWGFALHYAVFLVNHLPCAATGDIPILAQGNGVEFGNYARAFGCHAVVFLNDGKGHKKVSARGCPGICVGVGTHAGQLGWLVWIPDFNSADQGRVVCSTDVVFDELCFPLRHLVSPMSAHVNASSYEELDLNHFRVVMRDIQSRLPQERPAHHAGDSSRAVTRTMAQLDDDVLDGFEQHFQSSATGGHGTDKDPMTHVPDTTITRQSRSTTGPSESNKTLRSALKSAGDRPTTTKSVTYDSNFGVTGAKPVDPREARNLYPWQRATSTVIAEVTDVELVDYCFHNNVRLHTPIGSLYGDVCPYDLTVVEYDTTIPGVRVVMGGVNPEDRRKSAVFYYECLVSKPETEHGRGRKRLTKAQVERATTPSLRELIHAHCPQATTLQNLPLTDSQDVAITSSRGKFDKRGSHVIYSAKSTQRESHLQVSSGIDFLITAEPSSFQHGPPVGPSLPDPEPHEYFVCRAMPARNADSTDASRGEDTECDGASHSAGVSTSASVLAQGIEEALHSAGVSMNEESVYCAGALHNASSGLDAALGLKARMESETVLEHAGVHDHEYEGETTGKHNLLEAPKNQREAYAREDAELWREAERLEMQTLIAKNTFAYVDDAERGNQRKLPCRWVYALKTDGRGNIVRYKARLVARGDVQPYYTFTETSSPTAKTAVSRMLMALGTTRGDYISSFDIKAAFVSALIDSELYIELPEGYQAPPGKVVRLRNCLYGTKQASRLFAQALSEWLTAYGFQTVDDDETLFILVDGKDYLIVSTYVDDGIAVHSSQEIYDRFLAALGERFELSAKGDLTLYCGATIDYDREEGVLFLAQQQYTLDLLKRFQMSGCAPVSTPLPPDAQVTTPDETELVDDEQRKLYMQLVGSLLWLANFTRPDISFATSQLARFLTTPGKTHIYYARHVLRYLAGTPGYGITYTKGAPPELSQPGNEYPTDYPVVSGYVDASHAGCEETRISVSGVLLYMAGGPMAWFSRRQTIQGLSSCESEFMASSLAGCEVEYFRHLLERLGFPQRFPTLLGEDNISCIYMQSKRYGALKRSKHIDTRVYRLRELYARGVVCLTKVHTSVQRADPFTKPLSAGLHADHMKYIMSVAPRTTG